MTDETPHVPAVLRAGLLEKLSWTGPEIASAVLAEVDKVAYRGDLDAYLREALDTATVTLTAAIQPQLRANAAALDKARDFEAFIRMKTDDWVH